MQDNTESLVRAAVGGAVIGFLGLGAITGICCIFLMKNFDPRSAMLVGSFKLPEGVILGAATFIALNNVAREEYDDAGVFCLFGGTLSSLFSLFICILSATLGKIDQDALKHMFAFTGPALLWSSSLLLWGFKLINRGQ